MMEESLHLTLKKAQLARLTVTLIMADGNQIRGKIQDMSAFKVSIRLLDSIVDVPALEIIDVRIRTELYGIVEGTAADARLHGDDDKADS